MRALIVGATAGVGRALSEALSARGDSLLLVASDIHDLEAQAAYLRIVYRSHVDIVEVNANQPALALAKIRLAMDTFGSINGLFFPIGLSRYDDRGALSIEEVYSLLNVNLVIVMGVIGQFLPNLINEGNGLIVGFGSVAGIRGRRANIVYSVAKRGLESYFESLRHIVAKTNVRVQFYKLGYISTQQSFGKSLLFPSVSPQALVKTVVHNLEHNQGLIYFPGYWKVIGKLVSALPWFIFKRIDF